jgi:Integrase core domain
MDIRALVFDVNSTLIDIETDEHMEQVYRAIAHFLTYQDIALHRWEVRPLLSGDERTVRDQPTALQCDRASHRDLDIPADPPGLADRDAPRYLIRDRDSVYGNDVHLRISSMGIEEVLTAPRSPWQNPYAERLIGSIRRDCLNHFVILNARHLKRALAWYFGYYHGSRTHLGLDKQCPFPRQVSSIGRITAIPQLGGLHHRYERVAA